MIWTKTKYAVAAAGMLAVSAFAAVGQEPAAAPLEPAAAARLKEVEQKLDRVLKALEAAPRPDDGRPTTPHPEPTRAAINESNRASLDHEVGPGYAAVLVPRTVLDPKALNKPYVVSDLYRQPKGRPDAPLGIVRFADPKPAAPQPILPPPSPARRASITRDPISRQQARTDNDAVAGQPESRSTPTNSDPDALDRRISALESRLDRLEKRLDQVDRVLGPTAEKTVDPSSRPTPHNPPAVAPERTAPVAPPAPPAPPSPFNSPAVAPERTAPVAPPSVPRDSGRF